MPKNTADLHTDGASGASPLRVTDSMLEGEHQFLEKLSSAPEECHPPVPAPTDSADPASASAHHAQVLELMLAQAAKFSEFVNQSLRADGHKPTEADSSKKGVGNKKRGRGNGSSAKRASKAARSGASESAPVAAKVKQPALLTGGTLRDYQLEGYTWLAKLFENGINGILADEMGLGKTIQIIALVAHLREMKVDGSVLIVAPLSTVSNWVKEFNRFAPSLPTMLYHGSIAERQELRGEITPQTVVVTSYEISMRDRAHLARNEWLYVIVDEGHRLKNMECRLIRELKSIPCQNRLLLTGTPLQNNLRELFSLLNFLLPFIFDDVNFFMSMFDFGRLDDKDASSSVITKELRHRIVSKLHEIVRPFLLRRIKDDVELAVPPKVEMLVFASKTKQQLMLSEAVRSGGLRKTLRSMKWAEHGVHGNDEFKGSFQNKLMQLRKVACHPYLFAEPVRTGEAHDTDERIVQHSGKMQVLDRLLRGLKANGHRVLIFSQMTKMLDIIEDYMHLRDYKYCRIDGGTDWRDRQGQIDSFSNDGDAFCFLLSTRAGGLGINLTSADTVIIFDSDWNPHQDAQAQDRCHRIGQTKPVVVYRLVTQHSVEVNLLNVANGKRKLERLVITRGKFKSRSAAGELTEDELRVLLTDDVQLRARGGGINERELRAILDRPTVMAAAKSMSTPAGSTLQAPTKRGAVAGRGAGAAIATSRPRRGTARAVNPAASPGQPPHSIAGAPLAVRGQGYEILSHRSSASLL